MERNCRQDFVRYQFLPARGVPAVLACFPKASICLRPARWLPAAAIISLVNTQIDTRDPTLLTGYCDTGQKRNWAYCRRDRGDFRRGLNIPLPIREAAADNRGSGLRIRALVPERGFGGPVAVCADGGRKERSVCGLLGAECLTLFGKIGLLDRKIGIACVYRLWAFTR